MQTAAINQFGIFNFMIFILGKYLWRILIKKNSKNGKINKKYLPWIPSITLLLYGVQKR